MTLQLVPITTAVLSLAWQGQSGITYTLQTSTDLVNWSTLPYVVEGSDLDESYFLEKTNSLTFARLRYDSDGDTDDNSLPDLWEWQHFGYIGVSPDADPDLDGRTNAGEWLAQTDPNDFYNGEWPIIQLSCGTDWLVPAGSVSTQSLSFLVTRPSGKPWIHAPVNLEVIGDGTRLVIVQADTSMFADRLQLWTDETGRLRTDSQPIHVEASPGGGTVGELAIHAGKAEVTVRVHSIANTYGPPPRSLTRLTGADGQTRYSWTGDPNGAESIVIEQTDTSGNWIQVIELSANDMPTPDPESGTYTIVFDHLLQ